MKKPLVREYRPTPANDPDTPEWVAYREKNIKDLANLRAGGKDDRL